MTSLIETVQSAAKNPGTETSRKYAVAAALEVISIYAGSGNPKFSLRDQMDKLSGYADLIEAALDKK